MKFKPRLKWLLVAAPLAVGLTAGSAQAQSVPSQWFNNELNQSSDNSAESQNVDINGNGLLDVGDTLRGTFDLQTNECLSCAVDPGTNNYAPTNNEASGIFEVEVYGKTFVGLDINGNALYDFTFGPNAAFIAQQGLPAGSIIAVYEDAAPGDYTRLGTIANSETAATNGALLLVLGFGQDPGGDACGAAAGCGATGDEQWSAVAVDDPATLGQLPAGLGLGSFSFQISEIVNNSGFTFAPIPTIPTGAGDGFIQFNAQGGLVAVGGVATQYDLFDNVDITFRPVAVPEPAIVAILGLGLLGLGASRRIIKRQIKNV